MELGFEATLWDEFVGRFPRVDQRAAVRRIFSTAVDTLHTFPHQRRSEREQRKIYESIFHLRAEGNSYWLAIRKNRHDEIELSFRDPSDVVHDRGGFVVKHSSKWDAEREKRCTFPDELGDSELNDAEAIVKQAFASNTR